MMYYSRLAAMFASAAFLPLSSLAQLSFQNHAITTNGKGYVSLHADFNGDGREDLVNGRTLLLSSGDGTYQAPVSLPASVDAIGDFNHDGKLDFLSYLTNSGASTPTIYLGNGNGTFQAGKVVTGAGPAPNSGIFYLVVADVNHDEKSDFITVNETQGTGSNGYPTVVTTWLSNGDGTFKKGQTFTTQDPDPNNINLELGGAYTGDFDGDGKPDLAIVYELYYGPAVVQTWYGDGAGNLGSSTYTTDPNGYYEGIFTVADVNNDGLEDLIAPASGFQQRSSIGYPYFTLFSGSASRKLIYSTISTSQCVGTPAVADFNGDGLNDLAYVLTNCQGYDDPNGPKSYVVASGKGAGTFGAEQTIAQSTSGGYDPTAVRTTTGTRPDLVYTQANAGTTVSTDIELLTNTSVGNFPGCGLSGNAEGVQICSPGTSSTSPVKFSVSAAGPTPMRTAAVWVDGKKVDEQLTHAFSNYSFLDASLALAAGSHAITVYGTGWDNTLQSKSFTLNIGSGGGSCAAPASAGVHACAPAGGSTVASPVQVQATSTITGTLARMEVWVDGVKKYTETTTTSLNTTLSLAAGSHRFDIYAVNTSGTKWETTVTATVK